MDDTNTESFARIAGDAIFVLIFGDGRKGKRNALARSALSVPVFWFTCLSIAAVFVMGLRAGTFAAEITAAKKSSPMFSTFPNLVVVIVFVIDPLRKSPITITTIVPSFR